MENQKVSIIIPVYNCEKYITECIDSILYQKFNDYEVIIIDDGSSDGTIELIKSYIKANDNIRLFNSDRKGSGGARNIGIENAVGEYLLFIDGDDYITPNALEVLYNEVVADESVDLVVGNMYIVNEEGILRISEFDNIFKNNIKINNIKDYHKLIGAQTPCNKLISKKLLETNKIRFPEGLVHEDLFFSTMIYYYANNISVINSDIYAYRKFKENYTVTSNIDEEFYLEDRVKIINKIYEQIGNDEEFKRVFNIYVLKKFIVPFENKLFKNYSREFSLKAFKLVNSMLSNITYEELYETKVKYIEYIYIKAGELDFYINYKLLNKPNLLVKNDKIILNISKDQIKSNLLDVTELLKNKMKLEYKIENIEINKSFMELKGYAYINGVNIDENNILVKRIYLKNTEDKSEIYDFRILEKKRKDITYSYGSGEINYDRAGFSAFLDFSVINNLKDKNFDLMLYYYIDGIEKVEKIIIEDKFILTLIQKVGSDNILRITNYSVKSEDKRIDFMKNNLIKHIDLRNTILLNIDKIKNENDEIELRNSIYKIKKENIQSKDGNYIIYFPKELDGYKFIIKSGKKIIIKRYIKGGQVVIRKKFNPLTMINWRAYLENGEIHGEINCKDLINIKYILIKYSKLMNFAKIINRKKYDERSEFGLYLISFYKRKGK